MKIGVPREIKTHEYRVGLVPSSVKELVSEGHDVIIETNAGLGIGSSDNDYISAGARVVDTADDVFAQAELIIKVKEPQSQEYALLKPHHILFTYLHLAADKSLASALVKSGCIAIAYETVTDSFGRLPLLSPMSEVAGRLSVQAGAHCLEKECGGRGVLLGGVPGVSPAKVVVIGGGVVGINAITVAIGMEADVTVLDSSLDKLRELKTLYGSKLNTIFSTKSSIEEQVSDADLVIGAVLIPGASAPKLITRKHLKKMHSGAVIVDVAIDQGGCAETSRPTSYDNPTYVEEGVVHYCVANMPGAVARTSAFALNNATLGYICRLAKLGVKEVLSTDKHFLNGLNVYNGQITHKGVADSLNYSYIAAESLL